MNSEKKADYVKYRLKPHGDLSDLLGGLSSIYVLHCQKCYKSYDSEHEPECESLGSEHADKIAGCRRVDFLCNAANTEKEIRSMDPSMVFGVISCGLGVQTVNSLLPEGKVLALADSVPHGENAAPDRMLHGICLDSELCSACGQCYLGTTAGICPIANCAKSLLNGPCGGAENGKCEVGRDKNCAWEQIYKRLRNREKSFSKAVEIRDHSIPDFAEKKNMEERNRKNLEIGFPGGLHPPGMKEETAGCPVKPFPLPEVAAVFLSQHTGSPAKPIVKPGDRVKTGQMIAEADGFISSAVHASITGKIISIEERLHPAYLKKMPAVIIEGGVEDTFHDSISPLPEDAEDEEILRRLQDMGIAGLGGAMFPSHVKLQPPGPVDTILINGAECEPFLNADNRMMIEQPGRIFSGINLMMKILKIDNAVIALEDNKPLALKSLSALASDGISIVSLPSKYPQGAEKTIISAALGRKVPDGGLPMDAGVVVFNVSTVAAVYGAVREGMPLIERTITLSGDYTGTKGNFTVRIGTPLTRILSYCLKQPAHEAGEFYNIKMGGPMMGVPQTDHDTYTIKGTTGFTIVEKPAVELSDERDCIRCGRCAEVCPMELLPMKYVYMTRAECWDKMENYNLSNCFECGACEYVCSAKISILNLIKKAKSNVRAKA